MTRIRSMVLACALLALAVLTSTLMVAASGPAEAQEPTVVATTHDPLGPVRECATGNNYTVDAYRLPAATIVNVAALADRPDLAKAVLSSTEQDQRARLVVELFGPEALPCGFAYGGCATTVNGTICYTPRIGPVGPDDAVVKVHVTIPNCVVTPTSSCVHVFYCTPAVAALVIAQGGVPYNVSQCSPGGVAPGGGGIPIVPAGTPAESASPETDGNPIEFTG